MIYKSYLIEKNISLIKKNLSTLFYGENLGLKKNFKEQIKIDNEGASFINYTQEEVLKNQNDILRELNNSSLFEEDKVIFVENCNDKIFNLLEKQLDEGIKFKLIIFSEILDKKSKLRNFYDNSKIYGSVACYQDNLLTIQNLITDKLKGFQNLTRENINIIIGSSGLDRVRLQNEISKIQTYFIEKKIDTKQLEKLLNYHENQNFNELKDEAFKGNRIKTNSLLDSTIFETDKSVYYLNLLSQRLIKLDEINSLKDISNIEDRLNKIKPPIFWKDKPNIIEQIKKWKSEKIKKALKYIYDLDIRIKSNSIINKEILIRKLIIDLCILANV